MATDSCAWLDIEELIQDAAEALQVLSPKFWALARDTRHLRVLRLTQSALFAHTRIVRFTGG